MDGNKAPLNTNIRGRSYAQMIEADDVKIDGAFFLLIQVVFHRVCIEHHTEYQVHPHSASLCEVISRY